MSAGAELPLPEAMAADATSVAIDAPILNIEGIYEFPDLDNPGKTYVGQSQDIERRLKEHVASGRLESPDAATTKEVLGGKTEREIAEQNRIDDLGGLDEGKVSNQRNPVGDKRRRTDGKKRKLIRKRPN